MAHAKGPERRRRDRIKAEAYMGNLPAQEPRNYSRIKAIILAAFFALNSIPLARGADPWKSSQIIEPAALAKLFTSDNKPMVLQVGFLTLYEQSHIPGAEYCGPARNAEGIAKLRKCVDGIPRARVIVIYCGCCPWKDCPNVRPAFEELSKLGYKNLKVLDIPQTFGEDWVKKGYPVASSD
jgi:thiosulfate/3-mercaptopyruvate sulfurtransferase